MDWNNVISKTLMRHNEELKNASKNFNLSMKIQTNVMQHIGDVIVRENKVKVYWDENKLDIKEKKQQDDTEEIENNHVMLEDNNKNLPYALRELMNRDSELQTRCAASVKEIRMIYEDNKTAEILLPRMDNSEWWTMVCMVSGVGIVMFLIGILAVYVVYTNIRGPRSPNSKDHLHRDTSLRRMSSERKLSTTVMNRNQRVSRAPQRTDSERSTISEKSV
ncbi:hypothetical protein X777_05216 [Ooceraea biroi]|nr:hypothetical protein X777_05216 [Ooceraea biroi]